MTTTLMAACRRTSTEMISLPATEVPIAVADDISNFSGIGCEAYTDVNTPPSAAIVDLHSGAVLAATPVLGESRILGLRRDSFAFACTVTTTSATTISASLDASTKVSAKLGLRVVGATARYHWVFVVADN